MPLKRLFPKLLTTLVLFLTLSVTLHAQEAAIRYQTTGVMDLIIGRLFIVNLVETFANDSTQYFDVSGNAITEYDFKEGMIVNAVFDQSIDSVFGDEVNTLVKLTQIETDNITITREGVITELESYVLGLDDTLRVGISKFDTKFTKDGQPVTFEALELGMVVRATGTRSTSGLHANEVEIISDGTGYSYTFTDYLTALSKDSMTITIGDKKLNLPSDIRITLGRERSLPQSALMVDLLVSAKATKLADKSYRVDSLFIGQFLGLELIEAIDDDYVYIEDFKFPLIPRTKVYYSDGNEASLSDVTPGSFCAMYSIAPDFSDPNLFYRLGIIVIEKADFKFVLRGTVDEIQDSTLIVRGFKITTNNGTQVFKGILETPSSVSAIREGNYVQILAQRIFNDGQFIALEIKVSDEISETKFEYGGVVDSVNFAGGTLVISGIPIEITTQTLIVDKNENRINLDDIQPKYFAFVAGSTLDDGRNIAQTIRIINDAFLEYDASGPITAKDNQSISIGSLRLALTSETKYSNIQSADDLKIGDFIRVMYYFLPDRSVKAIWIERSDETNVPVHQMGRIDTLLSDGFISSGLHFTVTDSTEFTDERGAAISFNNLKLNASVIVEGEWNSGSDITATYVMQRQVVFLRAIFRSATGSTARIGNQDYTIDSATAIIDIDGKSITLQDILPGSVVEVTASTEVNGVKTAQRIQVQKRGTASGVAEEFSKKVNLEVLPTPVSTTAILNYNIDKSTRVNITLSDVTGRIVSTVFEGEVTAGRQHFEWSCASLSSGTYFVNFNADGQKSMHSFQVQR